MIKLVDLLRETSLNSAYNDAGEPDTGFLPKGKVRKLGIKSNKPEPWFEKGGYQQMHFPTYQKHCSASYLLLRP